MIAKLKRTLLLERPFYDAAILFKSVTSVAGVFVGIINLMIVP